MSIIFSYNGEAVFTDRESLSVPRVGEEVDLRDLGVFLVSAVRHTPRDPVYHAFVYLVEFPAIELPI